MTRTNVTLIMLFPILLVCRFVGVNIACCGFALGGIQKAYSVLDIDFREGKDIYGKFVI